MRVGINIRVGKIDRGRIFNYRLPEFWVARLCAERAEEYFLENSSGRVVRGGDFDFIFYVGGGRGQVRG
ncbi:hypothetical protein, partial [Flavilitoribacter nigricans]